MRTPERRRSLPCTEWNLSTYPTTLSRAISRWFSKPPCSPFSRGVGNSTESSFCSYSRDFPSNFLFHGSLPPRSCFVPAPRALTLAGQTLCVWLISLTAVGCFVLQVWDSASSRLRADFHRSAHIASVVQKLPRSTERGREIRLSLFFYHPLYLRRRRAARPARASRLSVAVAGSGTAGVAGTFTATS